MTQFSSLFSRYDRLVLFDTETTGLAFARDEIIEFAAVALECINGECTVVEEYDQLIALTPGNSVPPKITELTGITNEALRERGISKTQLAQDLTRLITPNTLLLAYNAHFDLSFLFYFLHKHGDISLLQGKDKLDLLTVYRDRHSFPHRLFNAIEVYGLTGQVVNSHRAVDDVLATVAVMGKMEEEKADLEQYINLFGYIERFGVDGKPIRSVTYRPQGFDPRGPIYKEGSV